MIAQSEVRAKLMSFTNVELLRNAIGWLLWLSTHLIDSTGRVDQRTYILVDSRSFVT